jgi:hypothetical protein
VTTTIDSGAPLYGPARNAFASAILSGAVPEPASVTADD